MIAFIITASHSHCLSSSGITKEGKGFETYNTAHLFSATIFRLEGRISSHTVHLFSSISSPSQVTQLIAPIMLQSVGSEHDSHYESGHSNSIEALVAARNDGKKHLLLAYAPCFPSSRVTIGCVKLTKYLPTGRRVLWRPSRASWYLLIIASTPILTHRCSPGHRRGSRQVPG